MKKVDGYFTKRSRKSYQTTLITTFEDGSIDRCTGDWETSSQRHRRKMLSRKYWATGNDREGVKRRILCKGADKSKTIDLSTSSEAYKILRGLHSGKTLANSYNQLVEDMGFTKEQIDEVHDVYNL